MRRSTATLCIGAAARDGGKLAAALLSLFFFLLLGIAPAAALDAPVVTLSPGAGTVDDTFELDVALQGKQGGQIGRPEFEASNDFDIESTGTSTRNEFVNGVQSFQILFSFQVTPRADLPPGNYLLPKGTVAVDGQQIALNGTKISIFGPNSSTPATTSSSQGVRAEIDALRREPSTIDFTHVVDNYQPYVGEQVIYRAEVATATGFASANLSDIELNGFWREPFGKNQEQVRNIGNTVVHSIFEALFPSQSGDIEIPRRTLTAQIRVVDPVHRRRSMDLFEDFFSDMDAFGGSRMVTKRFVAQPFTVHVKDLPPPPFPHLGYIPVGDVSVRAGVDRTAVKQGESVTLKIEMTGDANLKPYELPQPYAGDIADFKTYVDKPQVETTPTKTRVLFRKVFDIALVPQKAGALKLPEYRIVTFDPKNGKYVTVTTGEHIIQVAASAEPEQLVVRGLPAPDRSTSADSEQKTEIQLLGEGLYPQHVGPETYLKSRHVPPEYLWTVLLGLPLLLLPFHISILRRRTRLADHAGLLQVQAYRKALDSFQALENISSDSAERCLAVLRTYLGERFRFTGESLTSAELRELLSKRVKNHAVIDHAEEVFLKLQKTVYGGGGGDEKAVRELVTEARAVVKDIEKHA
jgi:hypothetical protein